MEMPLHRLAIVIPAYRKTFLAECLESIAAQTNQDFQLYVFDDHSPEDIAALVRTFESRISIHYHRFEENLGQKDLASYWNKCIRHTRGEEWLWIFSDDDKMAPDCVASFYHYQQGADPGTEVLLRFKMDIVDEKGNPVYESPSWPPHISAAEFLQGRLSFSLMSSVNEYIFSREAFKHDPFPSFPLAWCSDDAAWIQYAAKKGLVSLPNGKVSWRRSQTNISNDKSKAAGRKKVQACILFLEWLARKAEDNPSLNLTTKQKADWLAGHSRILSANSLFPVPLYTLAPIYQNASKKLLFKYLLTLMRAWPRHIKEGLKG